MKRSNKLRNITGGIKNWVIHPVKTFKKLSNNGKLAVSLIAVLIVTSIISLIFVLNTTENNPTTEIANNFDIQTSTLTPLEATITRVEGNVQYKSSTSDWEDASVNDTVATEYELKTDGGASRAVVAFSDGSEVRLDGDSHIVLDSSSEEKIAIFVKKGAVYNRVMDDSERNYTVQSSDAQYESQGTVFIVIASGDQQAVEVIEHSVIETKTNNTISEGNRYIVKSIANPSDTKKVERIDINEYKNDPFVAWNLSIDEANPEFKNKLGFLQDTTAPEITITSPTQDEVILTEASSSTGVVQISGNAPGATSLTITAKSASGSPKTEVSLGDNGSFTSSMIESPLGLAVFEIEAKDRSGNVGTASLRVTIQRKSAPVDDSSGTLLLIKEISYNKDKDEVTLTWYMGEDIKPADVRILYSLKENVSYDTAAGKLTPAKKGSAPGSVTNTFDVSSFDSGKYYFRACTIDDGECAIYSNTDSVTTNN